MKKIILLLSVVLGASLHASAQYWGGYYTDPCVQASIAVANSSAWVNNQCMQMQEAMMQFQQWNEDYETFPILASADNYTESQSPSYKDCYMCHGSGVCQTCNGKGWFQNPFTGDPVNCPNCSNGKCSTCGGSGKVLSY